MAGNLVKRTKKLKNKVKFQRETKKIKLFEELKTPGYKRIEKLQNGDILGIFLLGTLLSNTMVYYFRSSDVIQMWPIFLIILIAIILMNFYLVLCLILYYFI